ncbi:hypothetical protein CATMIT_01802, partial [Catenibacterium mitsuokai DSM 15897]
GAEQPVRRRAQHVGGFHGVLVVEHRRTQVARVEVQPELVLLIVHAELVLALGHADFAGVVVHADAGGRAFEALDPQRVGAEVEAAPVAGVPAVGQLAGDALEVDEVAVAVAHRDDVELAVGIALDLLAVVVGVVDVGRVELGVVVAGRQHVVDALGEDLVLELDLVVVHRQAQAAHELGLPDEAGGPRIGRFVAQVRLALARAACGRAVLLEVDRVQAVLLVERGAVARARGRVRAAG